MIGLSPEIAALFNLLCMATNATQHFAPGRKEQRFDRAVDRWCERHRLAREDALKALRGAEAIMDAASQEFLPHRKLKRLKVADVNSGLAQLIRRTDEWYVPPKAIPALCRAAEHLEQAARNRDQIAQCQAAQEIGTLITEAHREIDAQWHNPPIEVLIRSGDLRRPRFVPRSYRRRNTWLCPDAAGTRSPRSNRDSQ